MHYGITVPNFGSFADPRVLADLARDAEHAGWDGVFVWDHLYWGDFPVGDVTVAIAAIACATERVAIGPMVTAMARRRPVKLARELTSLDHLSGGRLIFGGGIGGGDNEFRDMGDDFDPKRRGDLLDEGLDLLTAIWSGEPVDHAGLNNQYHVRVQQPPGSGKVAGFAPQPVQQPRIRIWIAAMARNTRPLRRAARWDGLFYLPSDERAMSTGPTPDELAWAVEYARHHRDTDTPWQVATAGRTPGDDPATALATIEAHRQAAGLTWWIENINPWAFGWDEQGDWPLDAMWERVRQGPPKTSG